MEQTERKERMKETAGAAQKPEKKKMALSTLTKIAML